MKVRTGWAVAVVALAIAAGLCVQRALAQANAYVVQFVLVSTQPASQHTTFRTYAVRVTNQGPTLRNAAVYITRAPRGTRIIDNEIQLGTLASGATVTSTDTFRLLTRNGRNYPASRLSWTIDGDPTNSPPVARAGADQTVRTGQLVTLDATGSTDADGDPLTYHWSVTSRPAGSTSQLSSSTAARPTLLIDRPGDYDLRLVVNDGQSDSAPDDVRVSTVNSAPVANAGPDQTVPRDSTAQLDGSASSDPDFDSLTFTWTITARPQGSIAQLVNADTAHPSLALDQPGSYTLQLVVSDGRLSSAPDTVTVNTENSAPVANAGSDQTGQVGTRVDVDGSASSDADGDPLAFAWTWQSRPAGSAAALTGADTPHAYFVPDLSGLYVLQLIVNDGFANSDPDTASVTIQAQANAAPVANPDSATTPQDTAVTIPVLANDTDANGDTLTITAVTAPLHGTATVQTGSIKYTPAAGYTGSDVFTYTISDGHGGTATGNVSVTVTAIDKTPPTASLTASPNPATAGGTVTLSGAASTDAAPGAVAQYSLTLLAAPSGYVTSNGLAVGVAVTQSTATRTFVANVAGDYSIRLVVVDTAGNSSAPADMGLTVNAAASSDLAVSLSASSSTPAVGDNLTFAVTVSNVGAVATQSVVVGAGLPSGYQFASATPSQGAYDAQTGQWTVGSLGTGASATLAIVAKVLASGAYDDTVTLASATPADGNASNNSATAHVTPLGSGTSLIAVPNVVGETQSAASATLLAANLGVGTVTTQASNTVPAGTVLQQSPTAGTQVSAGSAVDLVVSSGASGALPPDPSTVATPLDKAIPTSMGAATAFLYSGPNPIQTGVAPGTIDPTRVSVLRGRTLERSGQVLSGVTITVLGHPEYGQTLSRADGQYDIAANGGGPITVQYTKAGYLPVQRELQTSWQEYSFAPDVALVPLDAQVTAIDLNSAAPIQVARGSQQSDADGTRQATLFVKQGTQATMTLADGSTQPLSTLHVRATEFTVGPNGKIAMPGELPPSSGYTYAVEVSADEALAAGARTVAFSQPLPFYVENFVGFPVGSTVPVGYYDLQAGRWVAMDNGIVLKILSITGGLADLDVNGDGVADDATTLQSFQITDAERQTLAQTYSAGQELWRVQLPHLTPWDTNWPYGPPPDADPPGNGKPKPGPKPDDPPKDDPCKKNQASSIDCQTQTLLESVPITGSTLSLVYSSARVPGRQGNVLPIRLSGSQLPPSVQRILLEVDIAGRDILKSFAPAPDLTYDFVWDGLDAYGRPVLGDQPARVRVGFEYPAQYYATSDAVVASYDRFGLPPIYSINGGSSGLSYSRVVGRSTVTIWSDFAPVAVTGSRDQRGLGLGGWSLSANHVYDPVMYKLTLGDGSDRNQLYMQLLINRFAGGGNSVADGAKATDTDLSSLAAMAVGPDGAVYLALGGTYPQIRRVDLDGTVHTLVGANGRCTRAYDPTCGDGGPASAATLVGPSAVAVAADGSVFIADGGDRIRQIGTDGIIRRYAGNDLYCQPAQRDQVCGDGGLALDASIRPINMAAAPDGTVYFYDRTNSINPHVRRISTDGRLSTIGVFGTYPTMAVGPDGALYVVNDYNYGASIVRVAPDGTQKVIAGGSGACSGGLCGDGGPATDATLGSYPTAIAVGPDGSVYVADNGVNRVRAIDTNGIILTVAGNGVPNFYGDAGDGAYAIAAATVGIRALAVSPKGLLAATNASNGNPYVRLISRAFGPLAGTTSVAAEDGSEIYVFDGAGRHQKTVDFLTGATRLQFGYDTAGRIATVTDADGNVLTVQHDASGNPVAIVAPGGQRTDLTVGADGFLASVSNPAGETRSFTYGTGGAAGLLSTATDPRGNASHYTYDARGRLVVDQDPAGGSITLARTDIADGHYSVSQTTAGGLVTTYEVETLPTFDVLRTRISPTGARTQSLSRTDGSYQVTNPDGTIINYAQGPDPRYKMQAPVLQSMTVTTPGGHSSTLTGARTSVLATDGSGALASQTDQLAVNGRTITTVYDAASGTITTTTPGGRQTVVKLDAQGRAIESSTDASLGVQPTQYTYDARGRVTRIGQAGLYWDFTFDALNRVIQRTDASGRALQYGYDSADRRSQFTLPSGNAYGFGFDASGNTVEVRMPGLGVHALQYSPVNRQTSYQPPGNAPYIMARNPDRQLTSVSLPGGRVEAFSYDATGRLTQLAYPEAGVSYSYGANDPTLRIAQIVRTPTGAGSPQTLAFAYDGSLLTGATWSGAASGQFSYTYDPDLRISSLTLASGSDSISVPLTYDPDGRVKAIGPFTFTRGGPRGNATAIGDGTLDESIAYDSRGRIATRSTSVAGQLVYREDYTYDASGRIGSKAVTRGATATVFDYTYDADGQLTRVTRDQVVIERYAYDANRNRSSRQLGNGALESATYDAQDRLLVQGSQSYAFDVDGFLAQRGSDTFKYSAAGELLQAVVGGKTVTYAYDGSRRRVSRTDAAGTTQYLYGNPDNQFQLTQSRDPSGTLTTYFYDDGGRLISLQRGSAQYYVATDPLGSPRVVTDATGSVVLARDYDAYGVPSETVSALSLPVGFAGGLVDPLTGLVRFGVRDYLPDAGRWAARDPAIFSGGQANLYAYVHNDPVDLADPSGIASIEVSKYDLLGAGLKIGWDFDKMQFSVCGEVGVGEGSSIGLDLSESPDDSSFGVTAGLEAQIGRLGLKTKGDFQLNFGKDDLPSDCLPKVEAKGEGKVCYLVGCFGGGVDDSGKFELKANNEGALEDTLKEAVGKILKGGESIEGKAALKACKAISL